MFIKHPFLQGDLNRRLTKELLEKSQNPSHTYEPAETDDEGVSFFVVVVVVVMLTLFDLFCNFFNVLKLVLHGLLTLFFFIIVVIVELTFHFTG